MDDLVKLSFKERSILESVLATSSDTRQLQRAQAILWVDGGESVEDVANLVRVSRQTIYNWINRFQLRLDFAPAQRLTDAPRSGRPRTVSGVIDSVIDNVIDTDPRDLGYHSTVWTADLLCLYLSHYCHIDVSRRSVSYALERLDITWKRPRHVLGRRSAAWRQAKGGLKRGSRPASEPSS